MQNNNTLFDRYEVKEFSVYKSMEWSDSDSDLVNLMCRILILNVHQGTQGKDVIISS